MVTSSPFWSPDCNNETKGLDRGCGCGLNEPWVTQAPLKDAGERGLE